MAQHWGVRRVAGIKGAQDRRAAKVQAEGWSLENRKAWQRAALPVHLKKVRDTDI